MPKLTVNDGIDIFYERIGPPTGEPLLLIMGIGAQLVHWSDDLVTQLVSRGFQVVRFDHRDVGQSTWLREAEVPPIKRTILKGLFNLHVRAPYTLRDMAADTAGLIEGLGWASAHVFGVSMGGMIGQVLASEHHERVRSLTSMMSTTGAKRYVGSPRAIKALFMPAPKTKQDAIDNSIRFFETVGGSRYPVDHDDLAHRTGLAYERGTNPRGYIRQLAAIIASGNRTRALKQVSVPTLVIHGDEDPLIPLSAGRATARAIPEAKLTIFEGLGHYLPKAIYPELTALIGDHAGVVPDLEAEVAHARA